MSKEVITLLKDLLSQVSLRGDDPLIVERAELLKAAKKELEELEDEKSEEEKK